MDKEEARNILGVHEDDNENKIKKRRDELVKKNHPDQGGSEELFKRVEEAYKVITSGENTVDSGEKQKATRGNENNQTKSQYGDYEAHAGQYTPERGTSLDIFFPDKFFTRIFPISAVPALSFTMYAAWSGMSSDIGAVITLTISVLAFFLATWKYDPDHLTPD